MIQNLLIILRFYNWKWRNNTFEGLQEFLNSVPSINRGGCGISAYILYKYSGYKGKIVAYYPVRREHNMLKSASHVYYKLGNRYYDSRGAFSKRDVRIMYWNCSNTCTIKPHEYLVFFQNDGWNSSFKKRNLLIKLFNITHHERNNISNSKQKQAA